MPISLSPPECYHFDQKWTRNWAGGTLFKQSFWFLADYTIFVSITKALVLSPVQGILSHGDKPIVLLS